MADVAVLLDDGVGAGKPCTRRRPGGSRPRAARCGRNRRAAMPRADIAARPTITSPISTAPDGRRPRVDHRHDAVDGVDWHYPLTPSHQGQHVVLRDDRAVLVGHRAVPAHLAVSGSRAVFCLQVSATDRVARIDRRQKAQIVDAVVRQHRPGVRVDEQAGGEAERIK